MSFNSTFYNSTVSYQNEKSFAFFILKNQNWKYYGILISRI